MNYFSVSIILSMLSVSSLRLSAQPGKQINTHGHFCKYSPWECNDSEFLDDSDNADFLENKISMPNKPKNKGDSELTCPSFIQPDVNALRNRAVQGPVNIDLINNQFQNRSAQAPENTYLFILMAPFTGSTAVSSLLATSPKLSTLCSANTWACEGTWILIKKRLETDRWSPDQPQDWNEAVHAYRSFWNTSRPVLMDKSPPNIVKAQNIYNQLKNEGKKAKFIMVTRSPCLKEETNSMYFQMMMQARKDLDDKSLLHFRYEDLLRDPYSIASKILDFLPELESIDPSCYGLERQFSGRSLSVMDYIKDHGKFENHWAGKRMDAKWEEFAKTFGHVM